MTVPGAATASAAGSLFAGLCDDAAVFPPGDLPLDQAVPAHRAHRAAPYAAVVGSFVLAAKDLPALAAVVAALPGGSFDLSLTVSVSGVAAALAGAAGIPAVTLAGLEVAVPDDLAADEVVPAISAGLAGHTVPVFVELPRDERRPALIAALSVSSFRAKLRTGGVRAELYPDERELAAAVLALVAAGVPFKATAGLHHAVRNTDPATGFEQHGFLNLLAATGAARAGAGLDALVGLLAERDGARVAEAVTRLPVEVRDTFRSFGTCSIDDPVTELVGLGLLPSGQLAGRAS